MNKMGLLGLGQSFKGKSSILIQVCKQQGQKSTQVCYDFTNLEVFEYSIEYTNWRAKIIDSVNLTFHFKLISESHQSVFA